MLDEQFDVDTMWVWRESKREGQRCAHSTAKRRRRASKSMILWVPSFALRDREGEKKEGKGGKFGRNLYGLLVVLIIHLNFMNQRWDCPSIFLKLCSHLCQKLFINGYYILFLCRVNYFFLDVINFIHGY